MSTFNTTDILVRHQLLGQYISNFGDETAIAEFYGKACWEEHLKELKLLVALSRILRNYNAQVNETIGTVTLTLLAGNNGSVTVKLSGLTLGTAIYNTSLTHTIALLAANLNTTCSTLAETLRFTAVANGTTMTISSPVGTGTLYNNLLLTAIFTGITTDFITALSGTITKFSGGITEVTEDDNCLTEIQAQSLWNEISKLTDICFMPIGTSYVNYSDTVPLNIRITEDGDTRITDDGDTRITN